MKNRDIDYFNQIFKAVDDAIEQINKRMAIVPNGKLSEELRGVLEEYRQHHNTMLRAGEFDPHALGAALIAMGKRLEEIKGKETQGALSVAANYVATRASALTDVSRNLWGFVTGSTQEPSQKKPKIEEQKLDPSIFPLLDSVINKSKKVQEFFNSEEAQKKYDALGRGGDNEDEVKEEAEKFELFGQAENFEETPEQASENYEAPIESVGIPKKQEAENESDAAKTGLSQEDAELLAKSKQSREQFKPLKESIIKKMREGSITQRELGAVKKFIGKEGAKREDTASKAEPAERPTEEVIRDANELLEKSKESRERAWSALAKARQRMKQKKGGGEEKKEAAPAEKNLDSERELDYDTLTGTIELGIAPSVASHREDKLNQVEKLTEEITDFAQKLNPLDKTLIQIRLGRISSGDPLTGKPETVDEKLVELRDLKDIVRSLIVVRDALSKDNRENLGEWATAIEQEFASIHESMYTREVRDYRQEMKGLVEACEQAKSQAELLAKIRSGIQEKLNVPIRADERSVDYQRNQWDLKKALAQLDDIGKIDLHRLSELNAPLTEAKSMHVDAKMSALDEIKLVMENPSEDPIHSYLEKIENLHKVLVRPSAFAEKKAEDVEQERESVRSAVGQEFEMGWASEKPVLKARNQDARERDVLIALYSEKYSMPEEKVQENLSEMSHAEVKETLDIIIDEYMMEEGVIEKKLLSLQGLSKRIDPKSDYDRKSLMSDHEKLQKTIEIIEPHVNEKFKEKLESQKKAMESTLDVLNVKKPSPKVQAIKNIFRKNPVQDENARQSMADRLLAKFKVKVPLRKSRESTGSDVNRPPVLERKDSRSPRNSK